MKVKKVAYTLGIFVLLIFLAECFSPKGVFGTQSKVSSNDTIKSIERPRSLLTEHEQVFCRKGYMVSYNADLKVPNWVAWKLTPERLVERCSRTNRFLPDPDLDDPVTTDDYKRAHFDRGHMCPAGDNRWNKKAMAESFYMTNICPQNHNLNRGDWKELEEACRSWARQEGSIYVVCGPIFYKKGYRSIGKRHVAVPDAFFKVIASLNGRSKAIGFIYKNESGNHPMFSYACSVDEVEQKTQLDFFPELPDEVEHRIESTYDAKAWELSL